MSSDFNSLTINKIIRETDNSISILFDVPEDLTDAYIFQAGQYLTLKFDQNGEEYRRAYSIHTSPGEGKLGVTSKRVKGGVISNHMNDNLKEGQQVEVMKPMGNFTVALNHDAIKDYYLYAGGSGITPMMSLIKTILEEEPMSTVNLFYGNSDENNIIFKDELDDIASKYAGQFNLRHILSDPIKEKSGFFSKSKIAWKGWTGYPNANNIGEFLEENPVKSKQQIHMICGPTIMMDIVQAALLGLDVPKDSIMVEYFGSSAEDKTTAGASGGGADTLIKVSLRGEEFDVPVPASKTILDAILDMKKDAPYSCTSGACSTCIAKVTSGTVDMDACYALDDEEVADGYILACQAHPTSDDVVIVFED